MSKVSVARCIKTERVTASMIGLLNEIAAATAMDDSLAPVIRARPICVDSIANQVIYVAAAVARAKTIGLSHAARVKATQSVKSRYASPLQINIAILGFGSVGSRVVDQLLKNGYHPTSIMLLSRQHQGTLASRGVRCFTEPHEALEEADLLVVCCQPGHLSAAAKSYKSALNLKPQVVILSTCCGVAAEKVSTEFAHNLCLTTSVDSERIVRVVDEEQLSGESSTDASKTLSTKSEISFPCDPADFFNRLTYCVAQSISSRGIVFSDAIKLAIEVLLGAETAEKVFVPPQTAGREMELCALTSIAEMTGAVQRELVLLMKKSYAAVTDM